MDRFLSTKSGSASGSSSSAAQPARTALVLLCLAVFAPAMQSPETRIANDGRAYTWDEFEKYYGARAESKWRNATPVSAAQPASSPISAPPGSAESTGQNATPGSAAQPASSPISAPPGSAESTGQSATLEHGFVCNGRYYVGVAARRPVFIPPEDFFVPQPQEWTQCACANLCFRCVYDGASLCDGCMPSVPGNQRLDCDCEAGCCGVIDSEATASSDEGAVKTQS